MRALKSLLVMAGALKRGSPDLDEQVVLIRAMRDANLPKFLSADCELFENLIMDLFPGKVVPESSSGDLERAIVESINEVDLQPKETFVTKVVQLYETFNVRFGVMLVGPTGGAKTTNYQILKSAMTKLRNEGHPNDSFQVIHTYVFNPKCIKMGELYGEYNLGTGEWTDGLGSTLIRNAAASESSSTRSRCECSSRSRTWRWHLPRRFHGVEWCTCPPTSLAGSPTSPPGRTRSCPRQ